MLTPAGWLVLVGGLASLGAGRLFGLSELYVLSTVAIALVLVALVLVARPLPELEVGRVVRPRRVHRGVDSRVELQLRNVGRRRSPLLLLVDPVEGTIGARVSMAPIAPGDVRAASYRLPTDRRGTLELGPLQARRSDPFGLATRRSELTDTDHLIVLPSVEVLRRLPETTGLDAPLGGASRPVPGAPGGGEFSTLREYVPGDDLRRVHWPSSARTGDLLVRHDDPPWQGHLTMVLDGRASRIDDERFELAVTGAASIVHAVARAGDRIRLVVSDGTDSGLVDAASARDTLLEHLALVQVHEGEGFPPVPHDSRRGSGTLVVIAGDVTDDDLAVAAHHGQRFGTVLVVAVGTAPHRTVERHGVAVATFPAGRSFSRSWHDYAAGRSA